MLGQPGTTCKGVILEKRGGTASADGGGNVSRREIDITLSEFSRRVKSHSRRAEIRSNLRDSADFTLRLSGETSLRTFSRRQLIRNLFRDAKRAKFEDCFVLLVVGWRPRFIISYGVKERERGRMRSPVTSSLILHGTKKLGDLQARLGLAQ